MKYLLALITTCLMSVSCAAIENVESVKLDQVIGAPGSYAGKRISICGWMESKLELCSLSKSSSTQGTKESIWVVPHGEWCDPDESAISPFEGWADVSGVLHTGYTYGHFGAWDLAIDQAHVTPRQQICD